jgi:GNAT superfamily N-acetyltransferase
MLDVTLRDATPVRIRSVIPEDRGRVIRGVSEMSRTSRYLRFFVNTAGVTDEQARYLTDVDQVDHVALCAVEPTPEEERGYGIARFVRDRTDRPAAEFAVAIIDEMQHRGLGTVLMAGLYLRAQAAGVRELRGDVLAENPVMPAWMPRLGATLRPTDEPGYQMIHWPILPAGQTPRGSERFAGWIDRLRPVFG